MSWKHKIINIIFILGCILVWLPFILPLIFAFISLAQSGRFLFDFLIPMEIFPVVIIGALLIVATHLIRKLPVKIVVGSFIGIILSLLFAMIYAELSGVASGKTDIVSFPGFLILLSLIIYYLSSIIVGVRGLSYLKKL